MGGLVLIGIVNEITISTQKGCDPVLITRVHSEIDVQAIVKMLDNYFSDNLLYGT